MKGNYCNTVQESDQTSCIACGLTWDTNDPEPPQCKGVSIVRGNIIDDPSYSPYCGNVNCLTMPRTVFNGEQFECPCCSWVSGFPEKFIKAYRSR